MRYATLALVMMGVLAAAAGPAMAGGHNVVYVNHGYHGQPWDHHHHHPVYVQPRVIVQRPVVVEAVPVVVPAPPLPPAPPVYYYPGCGLQLHGRHFSVGVGF
jgi:hypothetical protein